MGQAQLSGEPWGSSTPYAYLRAVFNELIRLGYWKRDNPLKLLRALKIQERELSFLTGGQIQQLLAALADDKNKCVELIARVCLETGARWGEAEQLRTSQVRGKVIQFSVTKSKKNRSIPIRAGLAENLQKHHQESGNGERYFAHASHEWSFREAVETSGLVLPKGQSTHVLRHTFASHFMMNGGNILALQKILGHQSLIMTMRYAHLAPDHLAEAVAFNPLAKPAL